VHALCNIHAALADGGILVDTQPISASPPMASEAGDLGSLDMRDWLDTIDAVDERFAETIAAGLYELQDESWFVVSDTFDSGPECLEVVGAWRGTRVPSEMARRLAASTSPVSLRQEVRLRLLRRGAIDAQSYLVSGRDTAPNPHHSSVRLRPELRASGEACGSRPGSALARRPGTSRSSV
jgi:hypothetical protein